MGNEWEKDLDRAMERMSQEEFDRFMDEALADPIYKRQLMLAGLSYIGVFLCVPFAVSTLFQMPKTFAGRLVTFLIALVAPAVLYPAYRKVAMWLASRAEYRLALKRGLVSGAPHEF